MSVRARFGLVLVIVVMLGMFFAFAFVNRFPLIEAPFDTEVTALFPDDIAAVYGPNDHGWWEYTMHRDSDRDPQELCEAIHAAMVVRFPVAIPGTGVIIVDDYLATPPYRHAYCGMPDWWGDPNGR